MKHVVIIGGTSGIGREIARFFAGEGDRIVLTGREVARADAVAKEIGGNVTGIALDLTRPRDIAGSLAGVGHVDHLVLAAIHRDQNSVTGFNVAAAIRQTTLKLVGYTEILHVLSPHMRQDGAVVIFGGLAEDRPSPGSTAVSTVTAAVTGLVNDLAIEIAPIRVNAIHPGIVADGPSGQGGPTARDVVDAVVFLLRNPSVNRVGLNIDGGWLRFT